MTPLFKRRPMRLRGAAYRDLVARIYLRARGLCEECTEKPPRAAQDPHHRLFRSRGGEDSEENLVALCRPCHKARHGIRMIA